MTPTKEKKKNIRYLKKRNPLPLPPIPEDQWCDFRKEYEAGETLKDIAARHFCDPRTVRRCILRNKSSCELGQQTEPTKLAPYLARIDNLFQEYTQSGAATANASPSDKPHKTGICQLSRNITDQLKNEGYTGSERTVRNYLRSKYQFIKHTTERKENDPD